MSSSIHFGAITNLENHANKAVVILEEKENAYFLRCHGEWTLKNIPAISQSLIISQNEFFSKVSSEYLDVEGGVRAVSDASESIIISI